MKKKNIIVLAGFLLAGFLLWSPVMSDVEQPEYQVISSYDDHIEIRDYNPMMIALVVVSGERREAINKGFRLLADYISGNNTTDSNIAMTAPVTQQKGQKIAMTAPVTQQAEGSEWSIHFTMPAQYSADTLPKPNNSQVSIREVPARRLAVIRFSGLNTDDNIARHEKELQAYLSQSTIKTLSAPAYAFYNPPWTLPFFRRNEVMVEVEI